MLLVFVNEKNVEEILIFIRKRNFFIVAVTVVVELFCGAFLPSFFLLVCERNRNRLFFCLSALAFASVFYSVFLFRLAVYQKKRKFFPYFLKLLKHVYESKEKRQKKNAVILDCSSLLIDILRHSESTASLWDFHTRSNGPLWLRNETISSTVATANSRLRTADSFSSATIAKACKNCRSSSSSKICVLNVAAWQCSAELIARLAGQLTN